jgi:dihydroorotate dehydrogenase (NAD+) catalytic subunit
MVIDVDSVRPKLAGITGGLSGPAIRPIAVRAIYQVHAALKSVPILGMGGVTSGKDALEMIFAGASGVSIGTATFGNPTAAIKVKGELEQLLRSKGYRSLSDAIGAAHE